MTPREGKSQVRWRNPANGLKITSSMNKAGLHAYTSAERRALLWSVVITKIIKRMVGNALKRMAVYGRDYGYGFTGVFLCLHSSSCVHQVVQLCICQMYLNKVI